MPTIKPYKVAGTSYIDWQTVTNGNAVVGSAINVSEVWGVAWDVQLGRTNATALSSNYPRVRLEASLDASGDRWNEIGGWFMFTGVNIASTTLSAAASAGATSITVASATNIAAGDLLFIGDTSTANWELALVKSVIGTTINLVHGLANNHASGSVVTDNAERYMPTVGTGAYQRMRVIVDNSSSGQSVNAMVRYALYSYDNIA